MSGHRSPDPSAELMRLVDGYLFTQLIYVAARLGVADHLADGPRTSHQIAAAVGVPTGPLHRVLRGLASEGVLTETANGAFGLTATGALLRDDVPGSLRGAVLARGDLYYRAAADLFAAVRDGDVALERAYGDTLFGVLEQHPDLGASFQASMAARAHIEAGAVASVYDLASVFRIVDVGGGGGILLKAMLTAAPHATGILFDQPAVVEAARTREWGDSVKDRVAFEAGSFFEQLPGGADLLLLSRVIHDWSDEEAIQILRTCRAAISPAGRLLLVEALLPARAIDSPAAIRMDLHMLVLAHGHERTLAEYKRLLDATDWRLSRVIPTDSSTGISIIEASPV